MTSSSAASASRLRQDQIAEPVTAVADRRVHQKRAGNTSSRHEGRARRLRSWSRTSVEERTSLVFRVGDLLRQRKMEFMAWLVFEVSKNWAEADADISETIDFCEFYAREALRFSKTQTPIQLPGERDT